MQSPEAECPREQEILVRFAAGISVQDAQDLVQDLGLEVIKPYPPLEVLGGSVLLLVKSRGLEAAEAIALLQEQSAVLQAEPNITRNIWE